MVKFVVSPGDEQRTDAAIAERHESIQENLSEGMLDLAHQLKETAKAANKVVRMDVEKLDGAAQQAEANAQRLSVEGKRLETLANAPAATCSCTVWLTLILVVFTFISMVVFIRLFPKGR